MYEPTLADNINLIDLTEFLSKGQKSVGRARWVGRANVNKLEMSND